ncbi:LamG-like jellyroll fold domain-containing protein, partial [Candidatus Altiarchaeota archaeon]
TTPWPHTISACVTAGTTYYINVDADEGDCEDANPLVVDTLDSYNLTVNLTSTENCTNTVDDDCDGLIDGVDPDCIITWPDTDLIACQNVTITAAGGALTGFPAYINVSGDNYSNFYDQPCNQGGNLLPSELEYSSAAYSLYWVKTDINAPSITISRYYNTSSPESKNPTDVWDSDFKIVLHLNEISGNSLDSTSNYNNAIQQDAPDQTVAGQVDGGISYDGNNDASIIAYDPSFDSAILSFTAWVKPANGEVNGDFHARAGGFNLGLNAFGNLRIRARSGAVNYHSSSSTALTRDGSTWSHIAATYDDSTHTYAKLYVNGQEVSYGESEDVGGGLDTGTTNYGIEFADTHVFGYYGGSADEIRVATRALTASWINQSYQMIANQGSFVSFGAEETI